MAKLKFSKKITVVDKGNTEASWRVLIVDDDIEVHTITRLALRNVRFDGRGIEMLSAYNAEEARAVLAAEKDIAIILLDVVMETDDAGLQLVRHIREELGNTNVRIILRTGQPGQAPEEEAILKYDINDYKAKTELTAQKLLSATITALRTYRQLQMIDRHRVGLQQIIESTDSLYEKVSLKLFATGVLTQLGALLGVGANGILCVQRSKNNPLLGSEGVEVLATSNPQWVPECTSWSSLPIEPKVRALILTAFDSRKSIYAEKSTVLYIGQEDHLGMVAYLDCPPSEDIARDFVKLFCTKIAVSYRNRCLYEQLREANRELEQKATHSAEELEKVSRQLAQLASTDLLTGVPNRRYFYEALEREIAWLQRNGGTFSIAVLDIDHFKKINDRYGHQVGDRVLQMVANQLKLNIRQADFMGRVGGNEFAVLFTGSGLNDAMSLAERLRVAVIRGVIKGSSVSVTASVGMVQVRSGEVATAVLTRVDRALNTAKQSGRNCIRISPESV